MPRQTAKTLTKKSRNKIINTEANVGEFRYFNNNKIHVDHTIQLDLKSGDKVAYKCQILVVPQTAVNLLRRDIWQKLGIQPAYTNPGEKIQKIQSIQSYLAKWVFQN